MTAKLEKQTQAFIEALTGAGGPPIYTLSPEDARNVLRSAQGVDANQFRCPVEDRVTPENVSVRIYRPPEAEGLLPAVVYIHGGGWVLGDKDTHHRLVQELAIGAEAAVVFVNYSPSPEAKFPVAIEQSYAALKWVAEKGAEAGLDGSRIAVAGDSVGGNMAIAVTLLAKERGGPRISFQLLFYPVTDANFESGSYNTFAEGPWLTRAAMKWFWDQYLPNAEERLKPLASPLRAPAHQLTGLPPALVITDENDVLRDEGEAYAHRLMEVGVEVTATRYLGTIHDFVMLNAISETPATRGAIIQAADALRKALS